MSLIESRSNPKFRQWRSLLTPKGLKKTELFILSGEKLITEFLKDPVLKVEAVVLPKNWQRKLSPSPYPETELSMELFHELDVLGTHYPLLVLKQPVLNEWRASDPPRGLELLCPLGDPQNLGALVRSAEALGAGPVVLLEESAHPFHPKAIKASAGALLRHPLRKGPGLNTLTDKSYYALDASGEDLNKWQWSKDLRLLVGEEGAGLPNTFAGKRLRILMSRTIESLNATVAAAIAIYSYNQSQRQDT